MLTDNLEVHMYSVNLYALSRINDKDIFSKYYNFLSKRKKKIVVKKHEQESLKTLVDTLIANDIILDELDFFFYNYAIPQIGKEFDILKIDDNYVLNIELKSQPVTEEAMKNQLLRNKYYLSHLQQEQYFFTYVDSINKFYTLSKSSKLLECSISQLITILKQMSNPYRENIDQLFRISDFLVSPLNTPQEFINDDYFLTQQQEDYKNQILNIISNKRSDLHQFFSIKGSPGTGKTLLLYDIAKKLCDENDCCMIHCGNLSNGHLYLNTKIKNLDIISAKQAGTIEDFSKFNFIFVDESHRIYNSTFNRIADSVKQSNTTCFWSLDARQTLSKAERRRDIASNVSALPTLIEYKLSDKIRTNVELASFIKALFDLSKCQKNQIYTNVRISFANTPQEAKKLIVYYKNLGYVFIHCTPSSYFSSSLDAYRGTYNTHSVIGQEFDNILMVMDKHFYYDQQGKLQATTHPNPDYLYDKLLYQGLTRVREKLSIIIIEDESLFNSIISIVL
jgi:DNA polymerase III delta prime subunit